MNLNGYQIAMQALHGQSFVRQPWGDTIEFMPISNVVRIQDKFGHKTFFFPDGRITES